MSRGVFFDTLMFIMAQWTFLLPTRPQTDTICSIFLFKKFGEEKFPGIGNAKVEVRHQLAEGQTFESMVKEHYIPLDLGGGTLDHHNTDKCTTELASEYLEVSDDPALGRLLQFTRRDDKEGKGILSTDPIDRAFGLPGMIASLNKLYSTDPNKVVDTVLPLLEAHYNSAQEHHVELPKEVETRKRDGTYREVQAIQGSKKLKVAFVISSKISMPGFLRSDKGSRMDVVVQKMEGSNHYSILTRQERKINLSQIMALIRLRELQLRGNNLPEDAEYVSKTGRIDEVPYWYYDPATNSLLNGSAHNKNVEESQIPWEEFQKIVLGGLPMGAK